MIQRGMAKDRPYVDTAVLLSLRVRKGQRSAGAPRWPEAIRSGGGLHRAAGRCWLWTAVMGLFVVMDIDTPEVKFSDRCGINCGKGVPLEHVRRSRTRVWGAKMIRYHR